MDIQWHPHSYYWNSTHLKGKLCRVLKPNEVQGSQHLTHEGRPSTFGSFFFFFGSFGSPSAFRSNFTQVFHDKDLMRLCCTKQECLEKSEIGLCEELPLLLLPAGQLLTVTRNPFTFGAHFCVLRKKTLLSWFWCSSLNALVGSGNKPWFSY